MRDIVEKLLAIFLGDPLSGDGRTNLVATPSSKPHFAAPGSSRSHASPFDLPSVSRSGVLNTKVDIQLCTGSPISRRKDPDTEIISG